MVISAPVTFPNIRPFSSTLCQWKMPWMSLFQILVSRWICFKSSCIDPVEINKKKWKYRSAYTVDFLPFILSFLSLLQSRKKSKISPGWNTTNINILAAKYPKPVKSPITSKICTQLKNKASITFSILHSQPAFLVSNLIHISFLVRLECRRFLIRRKDMSPVFWTRDSTSVTDTKSRGHTPAYM